MNFPTDVDFVLLVPPEHTYAARAGERMSITFQVEKYAKEPMWIDIKALLEATKIKPFIISDPKIPDDDGSWRFRFGGWMG